MKTLFEPFNLSGTVLKNRIVMAPLTRARATRDVADERTALYYTQRATAGLIVSEGTSISREGTGYLFNPAIYTPEQVAGWRLVTDSVHSVGGCMFAQLWHVGRVSHPSIQEDGSPPVSPSSKQAVNAKAFAYDENGKPNPVDTPAPRQLETAEVKRIVQDFARAAANAMEAGFDGVEIHGANGYLFEQFMNPLINDRTDHYSADVLANRLRFTLEVIDAVSERIGVKKVGIRLSPYGKLFDMPHYAEIDETYIELCREIGTRKLAYVHIMNQSGYSRLDNALEPEATSGFMRLLQSLKSHLPDTALILAGGMKQQIAQRMIADNIIDLVAFGAAFISNPDLVARLKNGSPLSAADPNTFYGGGAEGYIDYAPYSAKQ